jgi:RNA polymerase sigma factor (sigma-70 family)
MGGEDVTAETFAQAWLSRDRFRDDHGGSAVPWLLGIARNVLRETIRLDRVETRARERLGLPLDLAAEDGFAAVEERLSPRTALVAALSKLPEHEREALELRVMGDLPYDQVAERLAIRPAAARLRVSRGPAPPGARNHKGGPVMSSLPPQLVQFRSDLERAIARELAARPGERARRRRAVALAAAALVVAVGTASAFGTVRNLLFGKGSSAWGGTPTWSPNGRRIAYAAHPLPDGPLEVFVMNADGSGQRSLTREWERNIFPIWSPDWRKVAFFRNPCEFVQRACIGNTTIYVMNADGSGLRRLARAGSLRKISSGQSEGGGDGLAWSPDGTTNRLPERPRRRLRHLRHER